MSKNIKLRVVFFCFLFCFVLFCFVLFFSQGSRAETLPPFRQIQSLVPCSLDLGIDTETAVLESLHPPALKL